MPESNGNLFQENISTGNAQDLLMVWREALENHRHFNLILFQIRNIAFVFSGAVLAGTAALLRSRADSENTRLGYLIDSKDLPPELLAAIQKTQPDYLGFLLIATAMIWFGFYYLDRFYYHMLLVGANDFIKTLERKYPDLQLSTSIGNRNHATPLPFVGARRGRAKITTFYAIPLSLFLGFGIPLALNTGVPVLQFASRGLFPISLISILGTWLFMFFMELSQKKTEIDKI